MAGKDIFKNSLKRTQKVTTLPTRKFVTLSSKGEFTLVSNLLFQKLVVLASVVILALTIIKDMNREFISRRYLNQQFKCKKQKINL